MNLSVLAKASSRGFGLVLERTTSRLSRVKAAGGVVARKQAGFTLIELLVVIAIIGLLASVVLVSLNSARAKSRDAKRLSDIRQFANALEMYYNDNPSVGYPSTLGPLVPSYMSTVPPYPLPNDGSCPSTATAGAYGLNFVGSQGGYTLQFCLGAQTGGYAAGTRTLSNQGVK